MADQPPLKYRPGAYGDHQLNADIKAIFDLIYSQPYDLSSHLSGKPGNGAVVYSIRFPRPVSFQPKFLGSQVSIGTKPTNLAIYSIKKNGNTIGSISITPAGIVTLTTVSSVIQQFLAGDLLTVIGPSPQDATLSDVGIILVGSL